MVNGMGISLNNQYTPASARFFLSATHAILILTLGLGCQCINSPQYVQESFVLKFGNIAMVVCYYLNTALYVIEYSLRSKENI